MEGFLKYLWQGFFGRVEWGSIILYMCVCGVVLNSFFGI